MSKLLNVTQLREAAQPLRWREIESHVDGEHVSARGRVGTVTLRETSPHNIWADFQLIVEPNGLRVSCLAFPDSYRRLRTPLEPGQTRRVVARVSPSGFDGPTLHVLAWS